MSLVSITISTQFGVDVTCYRIIDNYNFYVQSLRESGVEIKFEYQSNEIDVFNIDDLLDVMTEHSSDIVDSFIDVHGKSFNSSESHKIFDLIDKSYIDKYGHKIEQSPVFQKYNELFRRIKTVQHNTLEQYKSFDVQGKISIDSEHFEKKFDELDVLLLEPHVNSKKIIEILDVIMNTYRLVQKQDKIRKQKEKEEQEAIKKEKEEYETKKDRVIVKNSYNQYVYKNHSLVIDPKTGYVVGVDNKTGGVFPLDRCGMDLCKKLKLKFI